MSIEHRRFEDLPVWQAGRQLVKEIYKITRTALFCKDSGLCDQIQRAVVSITSNIAEGHERGSTPDLIQFLFYAKGSAGEVRSQLYNAEDVEYIDHETAERLRNCAREISQQISAWIQSMQTTSFKQGPKYHKETVDDFQKFMEKTGYTRGADGKIYKADKA